MTPRPGHKRTLLIWGDGSKRDGFASARCSMGPANALLRHIIRKSKRDDKRNCLVFHADEYRTSKMGLFNRVVSRPLFSDMNRLRRYAACRRPGKCPHDHVHHSHVPGCKCCARILDVIEGDNLEIYVRHAMKRGHGESTGWRLTPTGECTTETS